MPIVVGVLAPETSWHFADLNRAAEVFGNELVLRSIDFASLESFVHCGEENFSGNGSSLNAFDAVIVRTMPRGSLQQIIFRMDVLHRLAASGVHVLNSPRSVEIAIDKYLSLSLMNAAGIPVPPFAVCQTVDHAMLAFERLGGDVVLKPIFGSMGKNIHRLRDSATALSRLTEFVDQGEVLYLQQYIDHGGSDIRILVVGDTTFAMRRNHDSGGWLTNVAQGGTTQQYDATQEEIELAKHAAKINQCRLAGVDIACAAGSSKPLVLEVNASPGWEALQKVCEIDVANSVLNLVTTNLG